MLQSVVGSNCKLIEVGVGNVSSRIDAGNFRTFSFYKLFEIRELKFSSDSELPGMVLKVSFVLLGNEI